MSEEVSLDHVQGVAEKKQTEIDELRQRQRQVNSELGTLQKKKEILEDEDKLEEAGFGDLPESVIEDKLDETKEEIEEKVEEFNEIGDKIEEAQAVNSLAEDLANEIERERENEE